MDHWLLNQLSDDELRSRLASITAQIMGTTDNLELIKERQRCQQILRNRQIHYREYQRIEDVACGF